MLIVRAQGYIHYKLFRVYYTDDFNSYLSTIQIYVYKPLTDLLVFPEQELYSGLLEFLNERGINEEFSKEIVEFYRVFEHQCYVNDFLGGIRDFCSGK